MLLSEGIQLFLKGGFSDTTRKNYGMYLSLFSCFLPLKELSEIKLIDILAFQAHLRQTKTQIVTWSATIALRSFFRWAQLNDLTALDYRKIPSPRKTIKGHDALSKEDFEKILSHIKVSGHTTNFLKLRNKALLLFLWSTACRLNEVVNIKTEDVDLTRKTVNLKVTKGGKQAKAYLCDRTVHYLQKYLEARVDNEPWLFPSTQGQMAKSNLAAFLQRLSRETGIHCSVHMIRKGTASSLVMKGCSVATIQKLLRHENLSTTNDYLKLPDEFVQKQHARFIDDCREFKLTEAKNGSPQWEISGWCKRGELERVKRALKKAMEEALA